MESLVLKIVLGLVVLAAVALFLRALLGGGKMLGRFADQDEARRDAQLRAAVADRAAAASPPNGVSR